LGFGITRKKGDFNLVRPEDLVLFLVLVVCLYTDLKERKIYNKVVFPAAGAGLVIHLTCDGFTGLQFSIKGLCLGFLLFFLPYLLGGLGAGDVKLLGAVGALKGPLFVFYAALGTALVGGLIAVGVLVWKRRLLETLKRLAIAFFLVFVGKRRTAQGAFLLLDRSPYSSYLPYGAAIFLGTLLAYLPFLRG